MAGQQQQGQNDNSMGFLWIIIAIFGAGALLWYTEREIIIGIYFQIKSAEISVISVFTNSLAPVKAYIQNTPANAVEWNDIVKVSNAVGGKLAIPVAIIFALLSILLYKNNAGNRYRKAHSMSSLAEQEKQNWPYITPILGLDLVNTPIDDGPWAMSEKPMDFAKRNKLLKEEMKKIDDTGLKRDYRITVTVKRGRANRLFARQLGKPWTNVWKLPPYQRALFAIFAAKGEGDRDIANNLLRQIAMSAKSDSLHPNKLNFKGADALLKKHENSKLIKKVINTHAFFYTVMASMIDVARLDGVLASAEFLWLKPMDRTLWYVLNTVGRQTAPPEVAGIFAHWLAEKGIERPLTIPMVDEASFALEEALKQLIYKPDEE